MPWTSSPPSGVTAWVPVGRGGHGAVIGSEAEEIGIVAVLLPDELADVEFAPGGHLGRGGIADVGVVLPDHGLGVRAAEGEQRFQRVEHVLVAQVPGLGGAVVHDPVVAQDLADGPVQAVEVETVEAQPAVAWGRQVPDIAVDLRRVGPVCLDRHDVETFLFDQLARDPGAHAVELGGAVRCLA